MPGIDVKMVSYGERLPGSHDRWVLKWMTLDGSLMRPNCRYNSEDSLEDNQSTTSSTESRQSDFQQRKPSVSFISKTWVLCLSPQLLFTFFMIILQDQEFIPTRTSGIMASKPAANPGQFTRINSNPLLISAQKQLLQVEEAKKKKKEQERKPIIGDDTPDWQSVSDKKKHLDTRKCKIIH